MLSSENKKKKPRTSKNPVFIQTSLLIKYKRRKIVWQPELLLNIKIFFNISTRHQLLFRKFPGFKLLRGTECSENLSTTEKKREKKLQNSIFLLNKWTLKFWPVLQWHLRGEGKIKNGNCGFLVLSKDPQSTTEINHEMFLQIWSPVKNKLKVSLSHHKEFTWMFPTITIPEGHGAF